MNDEIIELFINCKDFFKFAPDWLNIKDPNIHNNNTNTLVIPYSNGELNINFSLPRNVLTDSLIDLLSINLDNNKGTKEYDRYFKIYQNLVKTFTVTDFILPDHLTLELATHFIATDPNSFNFFPEKFKSSEYYISFIEVNKKVLKYLTNASEELIIKTADTLLNVPYQTKLIIFSIIDNNLDEIKYIRSDILSISDWEYIKFKHFI